MPTPEDIRSLRRDKYGNDPNADIGKDLDRLSKGEPLAYVIGWMPFLGLKINLDTMPLIPRPETEWWTEMLITHLASRFGDEPFELLDLCAGSGAIGLAVLKHFPNAHVTFGELVPEHGSLIRRNAEENGLDIARMQVYTSDLYTRLPKARYNVIASNPPYVPEHRELPESVSEYEPHGALRAGEDGLSLIRRIAAGAKEYLLPEGELWIECDSEQADEVKRIFESAGAKSALLHTDQYGRPRLVVSYW